MIWVICHPRLRFGDRKVLFDFFYRSGLGRVGLLVWNEVCVMSLLPSTIRGWFLAKLLNLSLKMIEAWVLWSDSADDTSGTD